MKVLLAFLMALVVGLLGVGGFLVYEYIWKAESASLQQEEEPAEDVEDAASSGSTRGRNKPVLARMRPPDGRMETFTQLGYAMEQNLDAVGWIQIPDTSINNVIMQSGDNRYYLRRTEDGNDDIYGCYFLDYESTLGSREVFRPNTIVYGHSDLKDNPEGPRFSELFKFTNLEFASTHPYVYITSPQECFVFEIFAVFYTDTNFDYIRVNMSDAETLALAQKAQNLSIYKYPVTLREKDRLLTLSTCTNGESVYQGERFVVMGRLLSENASEKASVRLTDNRKTSASAS